MTRTMDIVTSVTAESEFAATDNFYTVESDHIYKDSRVDHTFNVMTSESNCNLTLKTTELRDRGSKNFLTP
jgi:hypothetical protein